MELDKRKAQLIAWIEENADDVLMSQFEEVRITAEADLKRIVGSTARGEPITKGQMIEKLNRSMKQAESGDTISTEELLKRMKIWENESRMDQRGGARPF